MPAPTAAQTPPAFEPQITRYRRWLHTRRGLHFDSYDALWRWSTTELAAFWQSIWDYFELQSPTPPTAVLERNVMPGARWFPGAQCNYAQQVLRHAQPAAAAGFSALISHDEPSLASGQAAAHLSWPELRRQVASLALHLQAQGVQPGDRVAAYLPNRPETIVAFLAVVSIGAVWSVCAPDMGSPAVLDRFRQIEPVALIACDGVHYGGRNIDRSAVVGELRAALPSVRHVIVLQHAAATAAVPQAAPFSSTVARDDAATQAFAPLWLPFDHPLWIVYSSGTTGLPKPIVHGHGGTLLVALAQTHIHHDVGCSYEPNSWGERFHWYSSTGWVMWNAQMNGLLNGSTCCLFDGNPGGSKDRPDWSTLWRFAADVGATWFGAGAAFYANCMKANLDLKPCGPLAHVRALGTTGSPLSEDVQRWGSAQFASLWANAEAPPAAGPPLGGCAPSGGSAAASAASVGANPPAAGPPLGGCAPSGGSAAASAASVGANPPAAGPPPGGCAPSGGSAEKNIWWCNISGGTDFAGAFIGGNRELPQVPGQMQCRLLGCAVEAWNEQGEPVIGAVGELICSQPIPSMPLYLWGDADGRRYLASYFDAYPSGLGRHGGAGPVWRHGDWLHITPEGGCIIYGRSDATINRHGLRMGTSELYRAVEALPEVLDSLVVDLEYLGRDSYMPLFVVLRPGLVLGPALQARIAQAIRTAVSPRFVPDEVFQVSDIPRTLSGKKQELPIKKLLLGQPIEKVINRDAMANPESLAWYVALAQRRLGQGAQAGDAHRG